MHLHGKLVKKCYFRFRAHASVSSRELDYFLREVATLNTCHLFAAVDFYRLKRRQQWPQFGEGFTIEDDRLKGAARPNLAKVYSHDPILGKVVLRPIAGIIATFYGKRGVITTLGFFKFPATIRTVRGNVLGEFDYGNDWVFQGYLLPPDPRILEVIHVFRDWGYLDVLEDADFLEHYDEFVDECCEGLP